MSPKLYLNLLELEYSGDVQENEDHIVACFDRALRSPLPLESRLAFSQRKMEFLEDFGSDINMYVFPSVENPYAFVFSLIFLICSFTIS